MRIPHPFFHVVLNIGVAGLVTGLSIQPEYSTSTGWTSFEEGVRDSHFTGFLGHTPINFEGASDWATKTVNGVASKFWIRLRIIAVTTWTTSAEQTSEVVYTPNDSYFEYNESQIHGDVNALALLRLYNYAVVVDQGFEWVTLGTKSRGLDNFTSRLNAGGDNPTTWTENYSTDTSQTADNTAPGGNNATCTFATNQTLIERVNIQVSDAAIESDFEGTYRIYLRAKQVGGSAGDVSVQLHLTRAVTFFGETIKMKSVDQDPEIIDLGEFSISNGGVLGDEIERALALTFRILAKSDNGTTPNLEIHDLILIPVDETSMSVASSERTDQEIITARGIQIDAGILRDGSNQFIWGTSGITADTFTPTLLSEWETRGTLPVLEPIRKTRAYFLVGYINSDVFQSSVGQNFASQLRLHEQWISLRGSD